MVGLVYQAHVDFLGSGTYRSPDTNTAISGGAFDFSLCQSPLYDTRGLSVMFCVGYGGGFLNLATTALDGSSIGTKNVGFGMINVSADLQYNLSSHVLLSARLGGNFSIGDITAERADGSRIFKSSPWSGFATLGVGFRY